MIPLGKLLPARMREAGLARNIVIAQILAETRKWIIENWSKDAEEKIIIKSLVRGEIIVATEYPALAQELRLRERVLIQYINSKFGADIAVRIRFSVK